MTLDELTIYQEVAAELKECRRLLRVPAGMALANAVEALRDGLADAEAQVISLRAKLDALEGGDA